MNIQIRIKQLLEERNWSIYKLSKMSGVAQSTLSNIFSRNHAPTIGTLEDVCKGFDITMAQFFTIDGEPVLISKEQKELLDKWSRLSSEQKGALMELIK